MPVASPRSDFFSDGEERTIAALTAWWLGLENNRGSRAELRRAASPAEAVYCAYFHRLIPSMAESGKPFSKTKLAAIAGLASHIKSDTGSGVSLARQMASAKTGGSGARVSGLRFRRLLAVTEVEELYPMLIRVIRLLDGTVNLADMARSVYWWNERTRMRLASEYYAAAPSET